MQATPSTVQGQTGWYVDVSEELQYWEVTPMANGFVMSEPCQSSQRFILDDPMGLVIPWGRKN